MKANAPTEKTAHHHAAQELGASALSPVQRFAAMTATRGAFVLTDAQTLPQNGVWVFEGGSQALEFWKSSSSDLHMQSGLKISNLASK